MRNKKIINRLLPAESSRRNIIRKIKLLIDKKNQPKNPSSINYTEWIKNVEPSLWAAIELKQDVKISIVVPCYNTPEMYIKPLIDSVISQTYTNWELCLADGSTEISSTKLIKEYSKLDDRIKHIPIRENLGIVGNTNEGIKKAGGTYIAFLDHDDTLSKHALNEVARIINGNPNTDLIYSDEDKISDNGKVRSLPFFKPDWSPEMLLGVNYITHFVVARKSVVNKIGGLRPGFDGAQDYDFLLRFTEITSSIEHISKILYHWRLADGSTSKDGGEKDYADDAGQKALDDAVKRRKLKARVVGIPERPTNYRLKYLMPKQPPKVSIIIPFKDKSELLKQCVESILSKSTYSNYEIILVSNNSTEKELFTYLDQLKNNKRCKVFEWNKPFNYSAVNNFGRSKASGEYLVLLNNDTEVISSEWLEELVGVASQKDIGAVGPVLYYPDGGIQHAGIILGMGGMAGHPFRKLKTEQWSDYGMAAWPRNYLAVTGACLVVNTHKYDQVGGLDETFIIAGNDVALGIKLYEAGYRNVVWPFANLVHYENVSVGSYSNVPASDYNHSLTYYRPYLEWQDPYFNNNLDIMNEQIGIRGVYE